MPMSGSGRAHYQPIWADDVAACVMAVIDQDAGAPNARHELAGPDTLSHREIVELALRSFGRRRLIVRVPLPVVRRALRVAALFAGPSVFATEDEAELMEVPMTSAGGTAGAERLGVSPQPMRSVLGVA